MMSNCVCNRLWYWSQMWKGEIVRLKPNLLLTLAIVHGRRLVRNVANEPNSTQVAGNA